MVLSIVLFALPRLNQWEFWIYLFDVQWHIDLIVINVLYVIVDYLLFIVFIIIVDWRD